MNHFTKTETARRLRLARSLFNDQGVYIASHWGCEVGLRTEPQYLGHPDQIVKCDDYPGDLAEFSVLKDAAGEQEVQRYGYVAHMYYTDHNSSYGPELMSVCTVWLGTPEQQPVVLATDSGYSHRRTVNTD